MLTWPAVGNRILQAYLNERLYNKRKAFFWLPFSVLLSCASFSRCPDCESHLDAWMLALSCNCETQAFGDLRDCMRSRRGVVQEQEEPEIEKSREERLYEVPSNLQARSAAFSRSLVFKDLSGKFVSGNEVSREGPTKLFLR